MESKETKQMNKQNKTNIVKDIENKLVVARGKEGGEMDEIGERD